MGWRWSGRWLPWSLRRARSWLVVARERGRGRRLRLAGDVRDGGRRRRSGVLADDDIDPAALGHCASRRRRLGEHAPVLGSVAGRAVAGIDGEAGAADGGGGGGLGEPNDVRDGNVRAHPDRDRDGPAYVSLRARGRGLRNDLADLAASRLPVGDRDAEAGAADPAARRGFR